MTQPVRIEHDLLGDRAVPADAYYGIHTLRALENFPITGTAISMYSDLVTALACVKQAAAIANCELGLIDDRRSVAAITPRWIPDIGTMTSWSMSSRAVPAPRAT